MIAAAEAKTWSYGRLVNNWQIVDLLGKALSNGEQVRGTVPNLLGELLRSGGWRHFVNPHTGAEQEWRPHEFRRFIEADRPAGLGTKVHKLIAYLADSPEEAVAFDEALRGEPGQPDWREQPRSDDGSFARRNVDNINLTPNAESPMNDAAPPVRDLPCTPKGTSRNYAIRRLGKDRPDLLEKVKSGEMSPHGAMVTAGFAEKAITIPANPKTAGRRLAKHFTPEQLAELIEAYAEVKGHDTLTAVHDVLSSASHPEFSTTEDV